MLHFTDLTMGKPSAHKMLEINNAQQAEDSDIESESESDADPPLELIEVPNPTQKRGSKRVKIANSVGVAPKPSETRKRRQKTLDSGSREGL